MSGRLEIIIGPMFSQKTTSLLKKLTEYGERLRILYINSDLDNRSNNNFSTHDPIIKDANVANMCTIKLHLLGDFSYYDDYDIIGIDECHFFQDLYDVVKLLVDEQKKHVIIAGLNSDYRREDFGQTKDLIKIADEVIIRKATCEMCRRNKGGVVRDAIFSYKLSNNVDIIQIGGEDLYIPVCRNCYLDLNKKNDSYMENSR